MRVVTEAAIFGHRLMLPEERSALFSVTGITGFIQRRLYQQRGCIRIMWFMTVGTGHFSITNGMGRCFVDLGTLFFMTREADLRLFTGYGYGVSVSMYGMTTCTGHIIEFMNAALPAHAFVILMATQAH